MLFWMRFHWNCFPVQVFREMITISYILFGHFLIVKEVPQFLKICKHSWIATFLPKRSRNEVQGATDRGLGVSDNGYKLCKRVPFREGLPNGRSAKAWFPSHTMWPGNREESISNRRSTQQLSNILGQGLEKEGSELSLFHLIASRGPSFFHCSYRVMGGSQGTLSLFWRKISAGFSLGLVRDAPVGEWCRFCSALFESLFIGGMVLPPMRLDIFWLRHFFANAPTWKLWRDPLSNFGLNFSVSGKQTFEM